MGRRLGLAALLTLAFASPAGAVTITEFPVEAGTAQGVHKPYFITTGPDGLLWFTDVGTSRGIGRISTAGDRVPPLPVTADPFDVMTASDGNVYWSEGNKVTRRRPNGFLESRTAETTTFGLTEINGNFHFATATSAGGYANLVCHFASPNNWPASSMNCSGPSGPVGSGFTDLVTLPNSHVWMPSYTEGSVRRWIPGNPFTKYDLAVGSHPFRMALGPDGNLWTTDFTGSAIYRVTTAGTWTRFPLPADRRPSDIVAGPDGALWFTQLAGNLIGRMTTDGVLTEFPIPTPDSQPRGITVGPDGALWFTEEKAGKIARLTLDTPGSGGGPGGPGGPGGGGPGTVADRAPPTFDRRLTAVPARFRVGARATPVSARARRRIPVGTTLRFILSEPAAVRIVIARAAPGRRVGRACRRPTRANRKRPRCTRWIARGTLRRQGRQGPNAVAFTGRIGRRALPPGRYRATATARDAAGNISRPSRARFTIVRR